MQWAREAVQCHAGCLLRDPHAEIFQVHVGRRRGRQRGMEDDFRFVICWPSVCWRARCAVFVFVNVVDTDKKDRNRVILYRSEHETSVKDNVYEYNIDKNVSVGILYVVFDRLYQSLYYRLQQQEQSQCIISAYMESDLDARFCTTTWCVYYIKNRIIVLSIFARDV